MAKSFKLLVLGANSASPMPDRFPSSFVLNYNEELILIDCGEGAQIKMSEFKVPRSKIAHVFISHLHGDHIFGLPGFLHSMNLNGRKDALKIYGPPGLGEFLQNIQKVTESTLNFPIDLREIGSSKYQKIDECFGLEVFSFGLKHRISTLAYKFVEKQLERNIKTESIAKYDLSHEEIRNAKAAKPIFRDHKIIPAEELLLDQKPKRSFAYCSDTMFTPSIVPHITGVHLLYHEATYTHDLVDKAEARMHATARQAAEIAKAARVKNLVIGHYSSRYKDLTPLLDEARAVFLHTEMAIQGTYFTIG